MNVSKRGVFWALAGRMGAVVACIVALGVVMVASTYLQGAPVHVVHEDSVAVGVVLAILLGALAGGLVLAVQAARYARQARELQARAYPSVTRGAERGDDTASRLYAQARDAQGVTDANYLRALEDVADAARSAVATWDDKYAEEDPDERERMLDRAFERLDGAISVAAAYDRYPLAVGGSR